MDPIFDALALVRWLHFAAMFVLFGGPLFWAYAPCDTDATSTWRFGLLCLKIAAPVALVTGAGWLVATIVNMTGLEGLADPDTLHAFFFETLFGPIEGGCGWRCSVVVAILAIAPMADRLRVAAVALASGLLLVSQAWLGHAAEGGTTLLGAVLIAAYAAHVLAAAAWLGGLPLLLARIAELRGHAAPAVSILRLLSSYSLMATIAVGLVLASGVANAAFRVQGHFGAFLHTAYGDVLLVKIALVGLMLGLAATNRFVAMPRLSGESGPRMIRRLATSIGCEIAFGVLVLLAAAVLGITPPPA